MLTTTLTKDYTDKPHEHVACPLCSANSDYVLSRKGYPGIPVTNVICRGCGLIRINPRMTRKGYEDFYKEDFFEYLNPYGRPAYVEAIERTTDESFVTPIERNVFPYLLPYVKEGGRMLDVGAGFGTVPYLLQKKKGISYVGIEPDPFSRKIAKEKMDIELIDITIEEYLLQENGAFDLIFLDQVFEHLLAPLEVLTSLGKLLTPEGVIYIGVPGSYNPGVSIDRFYELAHTYSYTPATMRLFAEKAGLKVISVRDPEGAALEVVLARRDSAYSEEEESRMVQGSDWRDTKQRLNHKLFLNNIRGTAKLIVTFVGGPGLNQRIQKFVDRLIKYRY